MSKLPEKCYWTQTGTYQAAYDALRNLIPHEGAVTCPKKNKALERLRHAANGYYDLFNNGLGNRAGEFRRAFGFSAMPYRYRSGRWGYSWMHTLYPLLEAAMDAIILAACEEQGIDPQVAEVEAQKAKAEAAHAKAEAAKKEFELCLANC